MLVQTPRARDGEASRRKATPLQVVSPFEASLRRELETGLALAYESALGGWRKRASDLVMVGLTAPFWAPVLAVLAATARFRGVKRVFDRAHRVGYSANGFACLSLRRTSKTGAIITLHAKDAALVNDDGPENRLLGELIERLPQILNVIRGEMSLVGPRPMTGEQIEGLSKAGKKFYLSCRPGVFSLSDVEDDSELSLQLKHYAMTWSYSSDMALAWEVLSRAMR
ncbi:MAG: sugar transferase [Pseudomonadota bacterium]